MTVKAIWHNFLIILEKKYHLLRIFSSEHIGSFLYVEVYGLEYDIEFYFLSLNYPGEQIEHILLVETDATSPLDELTNQLEDFFLIRRLN